MSTKAAGRPVTTEHAPYYSTYIDLVPEGDVLAILQNQHDQTVKLLQGLTEAQADSRYAPDKWSIKELIGHLIDCERIMAYRTLRIARGDKTPIEGFEQDDYVKTAPYHKYKVSELVAEFSAVRQATILLLKHLEEADFLRIGTANEKEISARALVYIIAGHELHHMNILKTKYLG